LGHSSPLLRCHGRCADSPCSACWASQLPPRSSVLRSAGTSLGTGLGKSAFGASSPNAEREPLAPHRQSPRSWTAGSNSNPDATPSWSGFLPAQPRKKRSTGERAASALGQHPSVRGVAARAIGHSPSESRARLWAQDEPRRGPRPAHLTQRRRSPRGGRLAGQHRPRRPMTLGWTLARAAPGLRAAAPARQH